MSKTPLKQADSTLVQGAYNAAAAGIPRDGQDGMAQGMDKLMEISGQAVKDIAAARKEKQKEGDDLAQTILDNGGSLGTSWLTACQGEVDGMHGEYKKNAAFGRKNKTAQGMQDLNTLSAEVASIKDLNGTIAGYQAEGDWSNSATDKEKGVFNAFMSNDSKKRVSKDENGNTIFEVETPEGWMSTKDIERMAEEHKKDYTTMAGIRKDAIDIVDKAKDDALRNKEEGYTGGGYDITKATAKMDNTLKNANLKSLMHDDVLENGEPFSKAIEANPEITNMTYESLGMKLNADGVMEIDADGDGVPESSFQDDGDGKISAEEAKTILSGPHKQLIVDAIINPDNENYDETRTRGLMANYFTQFVKTQYENEYAANGGKYGEDAKNQYGDDPQEQADNFMKENNI